MNLHATFTRLIYWPFVQKLKGEYAAHALKELSESQWKSRDEILSKQWQMVRRVVNKAAQEVPYYRQAYKLIGWDFNNKEFSYEDFLNIPKIGCSRWSSRRRERFSWHWLAINRIY